MGKSSQNKYLISLRVFLVFLLLIFSITISYGNSAEASATVYAKLNKDCSKYIGTPNKYAYGKPVEKPYWHAGGGTFVYKITGCYYNESTGAYRPYLGKPAPEWICPAGYKYSGSAKCEKVSSSLQQQCAAKGGSWRLRDPRVPDSGRCIMPDTAQQLCAKQGRVWTTGDPRVPDDSYCLSKCKKSTYIVGSDGYCRSTPSCSTADSCENAAESCVEKGWVWDGQKGICKKPIKAPDPSKKNCENNLHRKFIGNAKTGKCAWRATAGKDTKVCQKATPYYHKASPYDICKSKPQTSPAPDDGGESQPDTPGQNGPTKAERAKVRKNCIQVRHLRYNPANNKCGTQCISGWHKESGKCVQNNQTPNPNNSARKNCEDKLHRVWKNGKCSAKCQDGFAHPKNKDGEVNTHKCVATQDKNDKKKPTVKLTQPAQKSTADKTIKLAAKAKDNVAVSKVVFYSNVSKDGSKVLADGKFKQVAEDTSKPYTTDLNTEKLADKTKLKVYAVAVDSNGNKAKSSVAKVTVMHGTGPVDPGEGDCSKNLKQSFDVALPAQLSAKKISNNKGIAVQSTCDAAGQSVDYVLKLTGINMTLQAADLEAYRQTADGKYTLSEDITIEDVDATDGTDKSYVEVSYSATDGDAYDLNSASAAILNHIFLNKVDDGDEPKKPDDDKKPDTGTGTGTTTGTTPGTQTPGTICTDNTDGSATCTDANGNTYSLGAKGKGAGVLPNTGTSALLGIFAVAAAGVGAVVYKIVKKRGASPATNPYDQM
ncbi:MAG: hypothetical protein QG629_125 [Patescibacteria group bacterium]|nr:hypothetical protein [Patescibacteria group bacterium]